MGQILTYLQMFVDQSWPPKSTFSAADIPDLTGKIVIVTGGYAGIGLETVHALLTKNAKVYIAGRDKAKAEAAISRLNHDTGRGALFLELDLADLRSVKKAAEEYENKETQLHILFNSAGVLYPPIDMLTADGYDSQFGVNVLGHYYFTKLLLPILLETAKSTPERRVRVVNTSSFMHLLHGRGIHYDTLRDTPARRKLGKEGLYAQSKYGNILFARELARRYGDQGIVSTSLHPGAIKTEGLRYRPTLQRKIIEFLFFYPAPLGALTQLYAGTAPDAADLNGAYLIPWARVGECRADAKDPKAAEELWNWCEEQVKDI